VWFVDLLNKGHIEHDFYEKVVTKMRTNFSTYVIFCCYIVREVVGKLDWNNLWIGIRESFSERIHQTSGLR
jgi:hypothetical protein